MLSHRTVWYHWSHFIFSQTKLGEKDAVLRMVVKDFAGFRESSISVISLTLKPSDGKRVKR